MGRGQVLRWILANARLGNAFVNTHGQRGAGRGQDSGLGGRRAEVRIDADEQQQTPTLPMKLSPNRSGADRREGVGGVLLVAQPDPLGADAGERDGARR